MGRRLPQFPATLCRGWSAGEVPFKVSSPEEKASEEERSAMPIRPGSSLLTLLCLLTWLGAAPAAAEDAYPARTVTLVNPLAVGGGVDVALRGLAQELQPILGQPVVVESRPGAGGAIAGRAVAQARSDGYTVGLFQSTQALPEVYGAFQSPLYASADLRPVVRYMSLVYALPSRADAPWRDLPGFVAYVRAHPGEVRWGRTIGLGHPLHLLTFSFLRQNGLEVLDVPFKGAGEAVTALLGGHIDVAFGVSVTAIQGHVRDGRISILAIHNPERLPGLPDVPTFKEQGYDPGVPLVYNTFFMPKGTPDAVARRFHDAVRMALASPSLARFAAENGIELYYGSEADAADELRRDRDISAALIAEVLKGPN
jgi:tripartite-type tricarboxylate transporter receptor subunit TctC